jgi:membrane protease YdiL (CAAX protease family)
MIRMFALSRNHRLADEGVMTQIGAVISDRWHAIGFGRSPLLADMKGAPGVWWRLPLGFVSGLIAGGVVLAVVFAIVAVGVMVGVGPSKFAVWGHAMQVYFKSGAAPDFKMTMAILVSLSVINGGLALILVLVASLIGERKYRLSFTTARRWRWNQLAIGLGLNLILLAPLMAIDVWRGGTQAKFPLLALTHSPAEMVTYAGVAVVCLVVAAGAEELVFRGWLLRHSAALVRLTWIFLPLNGLLFSAAHGDFDPNAFIDRTAAGLGLAYMALRLGGIEFSTGAHAANNLLIVLFIEPLTLFTPPPMPFDPWSLVESLVGLAIAIAGVELALGWPALRALMGPIDTQVETEAVAVF